ncbi:NAD-dependent epimerase/dehydratase family protein [Thalassotalea sp. G2M2-11]|uniref:NAD-dependent epimerase/dehydratase family protein n=1 Tax=Thalassotalea sp. G2M2-11 TaxID=2787627 RepID=UPI0019D307DA|nr:NAD-dependent epimerase/dehydratase family protein [Thalassotalea sp. G2M2-11]
MRVLVTGAAGSLGCKLIEKLALDPKIKLFATDIKDSPFHLLEASQQVTYQMMDISTPDFIQWVEQIKPNKVIHLASILQISAQLPREKAYQIDVVATEKLLEASVGIGVEKFIVTTSGAAYGYYPENIHEISETRPTMGNNDYFYSAHKAKVEAIMAKYRQQHPELKQIVFRPGTILGPDFSGPIVDFFNQKMLTGVLGYPGPFNFIWSEDVVDYLIEGLNSDLIGEFNIAGDGTLSVKEIANILDKTYLPLPAFLIQAVLAVAKPLGLTQYGPEQVKFIKYRPVLANNKIKSTFKHQPRYTSLQALAAFIAHQQEAEHE